MQLHPSISSGQGTAGSAEPVTGSRLRQRWVWAGAILALLLLLIFVPPLVNANRYQRQIARSMSESLGRPVHLDNATLHLLPMPGLTLSNLVVSEDPAFGAEPTIRANTVEATLRLGSLWRRRVEFSTVRFIEPSVNLVRNAEGRWNLADVLLHASHVSTAPTVQRRAGSTPRFPYIEASGGRVNIKLGEDKLPFSLTDADFALWLPSANQWRVRLEAQPARTDTNINDPGAIRLEGDLRRAETATGIPVDLEVSWHDAPLGEASKLITGNDMGWRGTLNLDAALGGTLSAAQLRTKLTLGGLRRADFSPAHPLDLQITCESNLGLASVALAGLRCTMPDSAPEPLSVASASVDLSRLPETEATVTAIDVPLHWGLLWAALFSARVPTDLHPAGSMDLNLQHSSATAVPVVAARRGAGRRRGVRAPALPGPALTGWGGWSGTLQVHLPPSPAVDSDAVAGAAKPPEGDAAPTDLIWRIASTPAASKVAAMPTAAADGLSLILQPVSVPLGANSTLNLMALISPASYTVSVAGTASAAALLLPARYLPQLGDGLDAVLPLPTTATQAARVDFTCTRPWGAAQTCAGRRPTVTLGRPQLLAMPTASPQPGTPSLLTHRSLSPLDRDPQLGGSPQPGSPPQP